MAAMRMTRKPFLLVLALPLVLGGAGAAAAADPGGTVAQSPPVRVIRGKPVDPFGHPIVGPTVTAVTTGNGRGGTVLVVRGAPSPLPSTRLSGFAPPPLGAGPTVPPLTGFSATPFGSRIDNRFDTRFDTRFDRRFDNRFDNRFDGRSHSGHGAGGHRGIGAGTTTPSISNAPGGRHGAFSGHGGGSGGHAGGFGGGRRR
jgi:hypothetical protein